MRRTLKYHTGRTIVVSETSSSDLTGVTANSKPLLNQPRDSRVGGTAMEPPKRPVIGLDLLPKTVLVHPGFVFAGHLDVSRLRESAAKVVEVYPELNVSVKGDWFTVSFPFSPMISSLANSGALLEAREMAYACCQQPGVGL